MDSFYLDRFDQLTVPAPFRYLRFGRHGDELKLVTASAKLQAPPTFKAYQGFLGLQRNALDGVQIVGICAFGAAITPYQQVAYYYQGDDLSDATRAVNKKLREKLSPRKGYLPAEEGPELLNEAFFDAAFRELLV